MRPYFNGEMAKETEDLDFGILPFFHIPKPIHETDHWVLIFPASVQPLQTSKLPFRWLRIHLDHSALGQIALQPVEMRQKISGFFIENPVDCQLMLSDSTQNLRNHWEKYGKIIPTYPSLFFFRRPRPRLSLRGWTGGMPHDHHCLNVFPLELSIALLVEKQLNTVYKPSKSIVTTNLW